MSRPFRTRNREAPYADDADLPSGFSAADLVTFAEVQHPFSRVTLALKQLFVSRGDLSSEFEDGVSATVTYVDEHYVFIDGTAAQVDSYTVPGRSRYFDANSLVPGMGNSVLEVIGNTAGDIVLQRLTSIDLGIIATRRKYGTEWSTWKRVNPA